MTLLEFLLLMHGAVYFKSFCDDIIHLYLAVPNVKSNELMIIYCIKKT